MDYLVRIGTHMFTIDEKDLERATTDFGPVTEWAIRGRDIVGRVESEEEKAAKEMPLPFNRRQNNLQREPVHDTITREAYYRRDT